MPISNWIIVNWRVLSFFHPIIRDSNHFSWFVASAGAWYQSIPRWRSEPYIRPPHVRHRPPYWRHRVYFARQVRSHSHPIWVPKSRWNTNYKNTENENVTLHNYLGPLIFKMEKVEVNCGIKLIQGVPAKHLGQNKNNFASMTSWLTRNEIFYRFRTWII